MSAILLTYVDSIADICQQYCRHMSANENNEAILKKYHIVGRHSTPHERLFCLHNTIIKT
jgi:hypothetical protein